MTDTTDDLVDQIVEEKTGIASKILKSDKKIGELNGKWAAAFKILIIIAFISMPIGITWATWITNRSYNQEHYILVMTDNMSKLSQSMTKLTDVAQEALLWQKRIVDLENEVAELPPDDFELKVDTIEKNVERSRISMISYHQSSTAAIAEIDRENNKDHATILVALEGIKTKLDLVYPNKHSYDKP